MSDAAELSALASSIEDAERRIAAIAARYEATSRDDVLGGLYEAERALRSAHRRVETVARTLR